MLLIWLIHCIEEETGPQSPWREAAEPGSKTNSQLSLTLPSAPATGAISTVDTQGTHRVAQRLRPGLPGHGQGDKIRGSGHSQLRLWLVINSHRMHSPFSACARRPAHIILIFPTVLWNSNYYYSIRCMAHGRSYNLKSPNKNTTKIISEIY